MDRIVIGRVPDPSDLQLDPLEVDLVGYTLDRQEVSETFRFRPMMPAGAQLEVIRHTDERGQIPLSQVVAFVEECLLDGPDAFHEFLHRPDVMIEPGTVMGLYRALSEFYAGRPTLRRSGSAPGGSPTSPTSTAARRSRASRSTKSR